MALFKREDIVIRYGGDDSRFRKVTDRVLKTGEQVKSSFGKLGETISGFFGRGLAGGLAAATTAMAAVSKQALNTADAMVKAAEKVGVTVEELQELRYSASAAGVEQRTLDTALQRFSRRVGEAAMGTGELYKEFDRLGIRLRDSRGNMRELTEILNDYADAIAAAESPQERLRLAFKAFDSEGAALVNMLSRGSEGLRETTERARELGNVMTTETAKAAEALNQQIDDMTTRWANWWQNFWAQASTGAARFAGFALTIEDREKKIEENRRKIAKAQEMLDTQHELGREGTLRYIAALERENMELDAQVKLERERLKLKRENAKAVPRPSATDVGKGKLSTTPSSSATERYADPTPAQLGDALARFRAGEISAHQLGKLAGQTPLDEPEPRPGAYGTLSNTSAGLPSAAEAGIIQTSETLPSGQTLEHVFTQAMDQALNGRIFNVKVRPHLIDGESADVQLQDAADKTGGTP